MLNFALGKIGGTKLGADYYWSSSEYSNIDAWDMSFGGSNVYDDTKGSKGYYVRPVMQY